MPAPTLRPCSACARHYRHGARACPFCGSTGRSRAFGRSRMLHMVGGAVTTVVLAACYGSGSWEDDDTDDYDRDGYPTQFDCDDSDADVNPDGEEICGDGIDNDCDGLIDIYDGDCAGWTGGDTDTDTSGG